MEHLLKCSVPTRTQPFFSLERPWGPHLVHFNWRPVYKEEGQHRGEVSHLTSLLNRTVVKKDVRLTLTQMGNWLEERLEEFLPHPSDPLGLDHQQSLTKKKKIEFGYLYGFKCPSRNISKIKMIAVSLTV